MKNKCRFASINSNLTHGKNSFSWVVKVTITLAILSLLYYFLILEASIMGAVDDYKKFSGLGFSYPISHYLSKNEFPKSICMALLVACEFFVFLIFYIKSRNKKLTVCNVCYFTSVLVLHFILWIFMCSVEIPDSPPFIAENGLDLSHYIFSLVTFLQALLYLLSAIVKGKGVCETGNGAGPEGETGR